MTQVKTPPSIVTILFNSAMTGAAIRFLLIYLNFIEPDKTT